MAATVIDKLIKLIEESGAGCWCNVMYCSEDEYCCDCPLYSDNKKVVLGELKELQEIKHHAELMKKVWNGKISGMEVVKSDGK